MSGPLSLPRGRAKKSNPLGPPRGRATPETPLHILSIATLFPDATRPNFGIFVERSLSALASQPGIILTVCAPVGLPPWPLSLHPRYAALHALPLTEQWHGLTVIRPRFTLIPRLAKRNAAAIARAVMPHAAMLGAQGKLDVLDAQFFWPDGAAAHLVAKALDLPFSIKARGSDVSYWARHRDVGATIMAAAAAATGILSVAQTLRDDMANLGMDAAKIRVHYTGLDAALFRPPADASDRRDARVKWGVPDDAPLIITVGALIERKGQGLVIEAMRALPPDTHYLMAGAGPDEARLGKMAQDLGMSSRVRQLGAVPNAQLPSLYGAADVMALLSTSEGLANVWVEAMACGVPLLLSDIPPAHEVLDGGDAGVVCPSEPLAIAKALRVLIANPPDRSALSARTHARFDWNRNGAELADHLRDLVARYSGDGSGGGT
ncbi:MAG: glycosyltransferase [Sphingopyxis sp.]